LVSLCFGFIANVGNHQGIAFGLTFYTIKTIKIGWNTNGGPLKVHAGKGYWVSCFCISNLSFYNGLTKDTVAYAPQGQQNRTNGCFQF